MVFVDGEIVKKLRITYLNWARLTSADATTAHVTTNKSRAAHCSSQQQTSQQRTQQPTSQQQQQPTKSTTADTRQQTRQRQTHDNKQDSTRHMTTNKTTAADTITSESCWWRWGPLERRGGGFGHGRSGCDVAGRYGSGVVVVVCYVGR